MSFTAPDAAPVWPRPQRLGLLVLGVASALLAGCGAPPAPPSSVPGSVAATAAGGATTADAARSPMPAGPLGGKPLSPALSTPLQPMARARNWDEFRLLAAKRMVAVNPEQVYHGPVPEPLLAIPVLEVELNADGSVRHIAVSRQPSQARDTVQLAIAAIHRAAPFSAVAHLPRPWKFTEVFLFDDERRFKPRSLDL